VTERFILDNALTLLRQLEERLEVVDERLLRLASVDQDVKLLVTIPGIQVTVAIGFLAAIGDIHRFPSALVMWPWRQWSADCRTLGTRPK
jgi:hypothetical protein